MCACASHPTKDDAEDGWLSIRETSPLQQFYDYFVKEWLDNSVIPITFEVFSMTIGIHAMKKRKDFQNICTSCTKKETYKDDIMEVSRKIIRKKHRELSSSDEMLMTRLTSQSHMMGHGKSRDIVIDILTGLIIDYEIVSRYCPECITSKGREFSIWYKTHKSEYSKNYTRSSNLMVIEAAEILWRDAEGYRRWLRMNTASHKQFLLSMVSPYISGRDTNMRIAITPGEKLALILRNHSSGEIFFSLINHSLH
ncbi:hypothetical protein HNY73_007661 [Argiope bruennichi]|uniref:Uncharacterized protein n=1 Tax=Argiope bruennichi TaxID=94029 RepID=A0A8T0FEM3_ARGBR|nr:hypothetical protein HNY73_007661 [Argiope bruennichi]